VLHAAIPWSYYTGVYRLFNAQHFTMAIGVGFGLEFFFTVALLFLQGLNNAVLNSETVEKYAAAGPFQTICVFVKFVAVGDVAFEFLIFLYECYRKHNLSKQSVDIIVTHDEEKKRKLYSDRYCKYSLISIGFTIASVLILSFTLPAKICLEQQALDFNTVCTDCELDRCLSCWDSGLSSCDTCEEGYYFNGQKCDKCDDQINTVICSACEKKNFCKECNSGYRLGPPGTQYEGQCLSCNDENCDVCNKEDGYCSKCRSGFYLDTFLYECKPCTGVC
jgi:hypothetical protein